MSALYTNQFLYDYEERYVLGTQRKYVSGPSNDLRSTIKTSDQKNQNVPKSFEENNSSLEITIKTVIVYEELHGKIRNEF